MVREVIENNIARITDAINRGDVGSIVSYYAEDAKVFPPNQEMISRKDAIHKLWVEILGMGISDVIMKTLSVSYSDDLAYEIGIFSWKMPSENGQNVLERGKYVAIWRLQSDGLWKIVVDIWNSTPPPPSNQ